MADNIDRDWNEMCNNLKDVIQIQVNFVHSISEKLQSLEIGTGSGGVGEWIEPGTQYTYQGTTYTVGTNVERFNLYGETGDGEAVNQAAGSYSHVEGYNNKALGDHSHAEGNGNTVTGIGGHAEGYTSTVTGQYSHAEGHTLVAGQYSHGEGYNYSDSNNNYGVMGSYAHVEGGWNFVAGNFSHAEGYGQQVTAQYAHAEGCSHQVRGRYDHAEGYGHNLTDGNGYSHAEGYNNECHSQECHIENGYNHIYGGSPRSHCEGEGNSITGSWEAHIEGRENTINGSYRAHCEGYKNTISGSESAHAGGYGNSITGSGYAYAEGDGNSITGSSSGAHAEGSDNTVTNSSYAHAEGTHGTITNGTCAHTEGYYCTALASYTHAQNDYTTASARGATAMGYHTISAGDYQLALGEYNVSSSTSATRHDPVNDVDYTITKYPFIIGNGHDSFYVAEYRSDAFKVDCDGKIYVGDKDGVDVSGLNVTSADNNKVLTASYQNGVGTYSWQDAPESGACIVHTYTDTALPAKVVLDNNNEYRYLSLTNANSLTISIETIDTTKSFYSTIVLHNVSSTNSLSNFVTVSGDSVISNIIFLNENNVDLSTADTAELLFFTNGMSNTVMCIAYAYGTPTPPTPPTPSYDQSKILVIELDANHDDTTNITDHATLAAAKTQLDTNYSTDPSKMYKLFIGDDAFDPKIGIEDSAFEDSLNLYSAIIGESIMYLAGAVFYNCSNLTYLQVPYSMKSFVGYNITGTNLPSLTVHSNFISMTGMVDYIFYDNNLTDLTIDATGTVYLAIDDSGNNDLYSDVFGSASYRGDTGGSTPTKPITINFGENVTGIVANTEGHIFGYNNQYGVTVNIPNSVTSISDSFLLGISDLVGNITLNIDNTNGAIPGAPWGAGSASNLTINYLR